jgi:hypothetical protein
MRDQRRLSLWPSCGELRHGLRPPGETKARKDKHSVVRARGLERWLTLRNYTHSGPRLRVLLTEGAAEVTIS